MCVTFFYLLIAAIQELTSSSTITDSSERDGGILRRFVEKMREYLKDTFESLEFGIFRDCLFWKREGLFSLKY